MRSLALLGFITIAQCARTVDGFNPMRWEAEERIMFGANIFWVSLLIWCFAWMARRTRKGQNWIYSDEEQSDLRRELRRHSRWRDR